ncbi:hypothetical protein GGS26DRAFT_544893 [Hypomontagnella submonticulosa]|nr:hypothetical protein GGS26DRAFT_544893 [Hypomontagnella submonticulosa]
MAPSYHAKAAAAACLLAFSTLATSSITTRGTSTTTSAIPGTTNIPKRPIHLSVVNASNPKNRRDGIRDVHEVQSGIPSTSDNDFIGTGGRTVDGGCNGATLFQLTNGQLSSGDEFVTTNSNVLNQPLEASAREGSITPTFAVVDGRLRWYNDDFYQGRARFCMVPGSDQVYAVFHISSTWPENCEEVDIAATYASLCDDEEEVDEDDDNDEEGYPTGYETTTGYHTSSTYGTHESYETSTDYDYETSDPYPVSYETTGYSSDPGYHSSTGYHSSAPTSYKSHDKYPTYPTANYPTPTSSCIYQTNASPSGQVCVETPLSWVPGSPTFLHDEL